MTIHELLQAVGLTADDEIPIWDVDGPGEPTKKITAQQLAAAVVALANLVTGVKGDKESDYRHGDVNLTPANIGAKPTQTAVADPTASGAAVAFIDSISQNDQGVISPTKKTVQSASQSAAGLMSAADKKKLDGIAAGAAVTSVNNQTGAVSITPANIGAVSTSDVINVAHGGTNATTPAQARANLEITPANIGAAADSAAMQYRGWYPNGQSMQSLTPGYYQTSPNNMPSETFPSGINVYGTLCVDDTGYTHITYISVLGDFMSWASNSQKWYVVQNVGCVPVSSGGTGMTGCTQINYTSNISDNNGQTRVYSWGMVCVACIGAQVSTDITTGEVPIMSINDSNYFPNKPVYSVFTTLDGTFFLTQLNTNGQITCPSKTISNGTWIFGQIVWFSGV